VAHAQQQLQHTQQQQASITEAEVQAKHDRLRALQLLHEQQHAQRMAGLQEQEEQVRSRCVRAAPWVPRQSCYSVTVVAEPLALIRQDNVGGECPS
jgi:hypothetical protein